MVPTKLTPAAFVLALICFALPFAKISCQGQTVATLTGIQALTGTTIQGPGQNQDIPRDGRAIAAFIAALVGAVLAFRGGRRFAGMAGVAGVVLLFVYKTHFESQIAGESQGAATVEFGVGFWIAVLSMAAGAVLGLMPDSSGSSAGSGGASTS